MAKKDTLLVRTRASSLPRGVARRCRQLLMIVGMALLAQTTGASPQPLRFAYAAALPVAQAGAAATGPKTATATTTVTPTATTATATATVKPTTTTATVTATIATTATTATTNPAAASCTAPSEKPQACTAAPSSLHLAAVSAVLPQGHVGAPYMRTRIVLGGVPGYKISVSEGKLPPGLALTEEGDLAGTPTQAGLSRFTLKVVDQASPPATAQQTYTLRVTGGPPAKAPARAASAPASAPKPPTSVTLSSDQADAFARGRAGPGVSVYRLTPADLDAIAPKAPPPPAPEGGVVTQSSQPVEPLQVSEPVEAVDAKAEAAEAARLLQLRQLREILMPLLEVEYPSRALFESAVDWQLCGFVSGLAVQAAEQRGLPVPAAASVPCPAVQAAAAPPSAKAASAPAATARAATTPAAVTSTAIVVALADLPAYLLPDPTRQRLIALAEKPYEISKAQRIELTGGSCGCVHEDLLGEIYGFYPFWAAAGAPQEANFSLLSRIGYMALPFDDEGSLQMPANWDADNTGFVQVAQRHGTRLDLIVYRNDWKRLLGQSDARLERVARELARSAVQAADTPLRDRASRLKRFVPLYSQRPAMAEGITLYFDNFPTAVDAADTRRFTSFFGKLIQALTAQLRKGGRTYALNIAVSDRQIGRAPFDYPALFEHILRAEEPLLENDRILDESENYRSRTNVTVKFLVLLSEPTTLSKKALRKSIEDASGIYGNNRRVLLRKMVAVVSHNNADPQQFADDLAYFRDNFGGVGLWRMPVVDEGAAAAQYAALNRAMRRDGAEEITGLCNLVCTNRWPLRAAFYVLLLADLVALGVIVWLGGLGCVGRRWLMAMLACLILTVLLGGGLLNCDPELKGWREGNELLKFFLVATLLGAVYFMVRPRDVPP